MRGIARRVEAKPANDLTAVQTVRSTWFQYPVQHTGSVLAPYKLKQGTPQADTSNAYIEGARSLISTSAGGAQVAVNTSCRSTETRHAYRMRTVLRS